MTDLDKLARGLTGVEQSALFFPGGCPNRNAVKALKRKELIKWGTLTPLGLEVRAALERMKEHD